MPLIKDKNLDKFVKVAANNLWKKNGVELPYPPTHPPQKKQTAAGDRGSTGQTVKSTGENLQLANENIKCKSANSVAKVELAALGEPMNELVDMVVACNLTCKTIPDVGTDSYECFASNAAYCHYTRDLDFEVIPQEFEGDPDEWVAKFTVSVQGGDVPAGTSWEPEMVLNFAGSDEAEVKVEMTWDDTVDRWELKYDHTTDDGSVGNKITVHVDPNTVKEFIVYLNASPVDAVTMHGQINKEGTYLNQGVAVVDLGPAEAEHKLSSYIRGVIFYSGVVQED